MESIDEVLAKLDSIIEDCLESDSRIGFFAILYRKVTQRVKDGIIAEEFEDNPRMEKLDVLFAQRFTNAYDKWKDSSAFTQSWDTAFEAAKSSKHLVLQHLFLGINAHINLDLGIAASETMNGLDIEDLEGDFNKINQVLAELVEDVKADLSAISPLFGLLVPLAKGKDEILLNFSIELARDGAWKFAKEYHTSANKAEAIVERDIKISALGQKLRNPGKFLSIIIKMIRILEWKSPKRIMSKLQ